MRLLILAILMAGGSYFATTLPGPKLQRAGWCGLAFFGLACVPIVVQLFRSGPAVILDESGILDVRSYGLIPWTDMTSLSIAPVGSTCSLCIGVRDLDVYLSRLPAYVRWLARGRTDLTICFSGLSPGIDEVWTYVRQRHPEIIVA